jgi:hypothetical protein
LFGTLVTQFARARSAAWPRRASAATCVAGMVLALYVFMADAIGIVAQGEVALRQMLPARFNWPLFGIALLLLAVPVLDVAKQVHLSRNKPSTD